MAKNKLDVKALRELQRAGELETAKTGYLAILRKKPRDVEALHSLGILYAQQDNFTDAIDCLQKAVKLEPHNSILSLHLANFLKFQGLYSQAAQLLEDTLKDHPKFVPAINNLGTIYYAQGKLNEAAHCFKSAIEKEPNYIDAYYNFGLVLSKKNDFDAAIEIYNKLLTMAPDHFAALFHLGCALMLSDKIDEAIKVFLQIEANQPNHFETQSNLATCFLKRGELNEAKLHYFKALELMPNDIQILFNLGVINMQQGQVDTAIQHYQRAVQINPDDFAIHNNLGVAFLAKQHLGFALQHFQEALRIQPKNEAVQHTLKILSEHQHLLASPPAYVKSLFDSYADHYEPHLLTALDYQLPTLLQRAVLETAKPQPSSWDILDLGCGTGLCGVPFKPFAKSLVGVDLSPKMLEIAADKKIYDQLIEQDLVPFLQDKNSSYDVILAGDVLVYLGDLTDIFKTVHAALREKGLFVFNTEIRDDADYKMNQSGRFAHQKKYLEKMATQNQFKISYYQKVVTRQQNNEPVYGHLFILTK